MSEENKEGSAQTQQNVSEESVNDVVSRKAYEEVTRDMHKNKQKAKELDMKLKELETQLKAQEEAKMQENEQYKELLERRTQELEEERRKAQEKDQTINRSVKLSALKNELGGKVKDQYLSFANLDNIELENGIVDAESLRNVANEFRKEHGQLIPTSDSANVTGHAASSASNIEAPKKISEMSTAELKKYYAQLKSE